MSTRCVTERACGPVPGCIGTGPAGLPHAGGRGTSGRMPLGIVIVMAKAPVAGFAKTRLCPPLTPGQASRLAAAFASDTLAMLVGLGDVAVRLAVAGGPERGAAAPGEAADGEDAAEAFFAFCGRHRIPVEDQGDGDLGRRMERLMARGLGTGLPTVLVGTDCPDLPPAAIRAAFAALGRVDAVLVPVVDGGYVLVGARRPVAGLFAIDAEWSSDRVFEATREALVRSGAAFEVLGEQDDVDDAAALGRLAARLEGGDALVATRTAALIEEWRREGVRF